MKGKTEGRKEIRKNEFNERCKGGRKEERMKRWKERRGGVG